MLNFEDVFVPASDGVKLHMYLITQPTEKETREAPTILILHVRAEERLSVVVRVVADPLSTDDGGRRTTRQTPATW